ncbi:MAG: NADH-ubiquinone oxidoreductase 39 kDa subunit precursor [Caulobacteraceae bacterium]|nr:NADH-ubiquinone oxidoreductase 39 kDa subunit precursor [Caulobacteraceae bacterium]
MQGLVTVFGGSGFVGSQVVRALARSDAPVGASRIRVAVRNVGRGYRLRMLGDVGQIEVVQANLRDPDSVARALDGAQAVVNLPGVLYETGRQSFESVHVDGARTVAEAARVEGVKTFVQMSALGADLNSPSQYARTKAQGEIAVREIHPDAVVIRPSIVFGQDDNFFNRFAAMAALSPALPLIGGGHSRFQPVYVADVAAAIARAVVDPAAAGRTYELGGPATYTFRELMELVLRETLRRRALVPVPWGVSRFLGQVAQLAAPMMPPPITADQVELLKTDNVVSPGAPGLAELGVQPTALEPILPTYLYRFRKGGQFAEVAAKV